MCVFLRILLIFKTFLEKCENYKNFVSDKILTHFNLF